jgi:hypothetical protein
LLPQSNGDKRTGAGITAGAGVLWRRLTFDLAYVREAVSGKIAEFPTTAFGGFSVSQKEGSADKAVVRQFLVSVGTRF